MLKKEKYSRIYGRMEQTELQSIADPEDRRRTDPVLTGRQFRPGGSCSRLQRRRTIPITNGEG